MPERPSMPALAVPRAPVHGLWVFGWVRLRTAVYGARTLLHEPVKLWVILGAWGTLLTGLYAIAYQGMHFVYETAGLGPFLLGRLWFLFLFVIMVLTAVSQLASAYSTLVRAPETRAWMTLPVAARTLCRVKWLESSLYTAWSAVALVLPMGLAYLVLLERPWWLVLWLAGVLLVPLTGIVTALATAILLLWLRWVGRLAIRREWMAAAFLAACVGLFWLFKEPQAGNVQDAWFIALQELFPRMRIAMSMWFPSSWAATALEAGVSGRWTEGWLYAGLLWSTLLLVWRVLDHVAGGILLPVLREHTQPLVRFEARAAGSTAMPVAWWTRHPFLASLAKDVLLVARDPMQWSQGLIFFGLLGAYFANIHRFGHFSVEPGWRIGIASLNLACTLLVFGSLAIRFVFPQMSLEGRNLWLLRVAPHGLRHLLMAKVGLYGLLGVLIIGGLLALSVSRLEVPMPMRWCLAGIGLIGALTLVGMAVGLGAWWFDPDAQDAARVVSSSSGALALVLMLAYVGVVVFALVVVWTSWVTRHVAGLAGAWLGLVAVSAVAGLWPLWRGLGRLERLEPSV